MVLGAPSFAKVDRRLMGKIEKPVCVDPQKVEYAVPDLEKGIDCLDGYAANLESRVGALQSAIWVREAAAKKLESK